MLPVATAVVGSIKLRDQARTMVIHQCAVVPDAAPHVAYSIYPMQSLRKKNSKVISSVNDK